MNNLSRYVTLRELGTACGVSATTASLALRNHPRISEPTKERVREIAEKLGYRKHPMLSALMTNLLHARVPTDLVPVAVLYGHSEAHIGTHRFHQAIRAGMEKRARELGFRIDPFFLDQSGMTLKRVMQIITARGIQGVIVPPLPTPGSHLDLNWEKVSALAIGYSMQSPALQRVCPDQYAAIRMAMEEIWKLGYRRPGLLLNKQSDLRTLHLFSSGYYGFVHSHLKDGFVPILECDEIKEAVLTRWYDQYRPDVIISSDLTILGPLRQGGISFPKDVGLVSLGGHDPVHGVAGADQNAQTIGSAALERLVEMMYYNERGIPNMPRTILIPPEWHHDVSLVKQHSA